MPKLLLATHNRGKLREYSSLFRDIPFQLTSLAEEGIEVEVEEQGTSLEENARLKAAFYAARSEMLTLADDSGLEVEALGGEPGVLSARYAGEDASDEENVSLLLCRLKGMPWEKRSARFRCVIALVHSRDGVNEVRLFDGECQGIIAFAPRGSQGFGYDPVFYLPEFDRTMAELSMEEKNRISHRRMAAQKASQALKRCGEPVETIKSNGDLNS